MTETFRMIYDLAALACVGIVLWRVIYSGTLAILNRAWPSRPLYDFMFTPEWEAAHAGEIVPWRPDIPIRSGEVSFSFLPWDIRYELMLREMLEEKNMPRVAILDGDRL